MRQSGSHAVWKGLQLLGSAFLCLFLAPAVPAADARPLTLRHLTTANGLPQATVMTTLRDARGFVWLGTEDGLMRYDGQRLFRYSRSLEGARALPGNFIWQVVEDPGHDLWVAMKDAGVARWRRASDQFESFTHDPQRPDSLSSDDARALLVDASGHIWVATADAGISVLDPASGSFRHLRHDRADSSSLGSDQVHTLLLDRSGDVWIGTAAGVDHWDAENSRISRIRFRGGSTPMRGPVSRIIEDTDGTLWVGSSEAGLARIDREGRVLERHTHLPGVSHSLASNDVRALLRDTQGNLWVGTENGLSLRASGGRRFIHYRRDDGDAESLRDSFIVSLYQDDSGLVWIGTRLGGVSRWNPRSWEMGGQRPEWLRDQPVFSFADAPDGDVWVASLAGLFRFNPRTGSARNVDQVLGRSNALGDRRVTALRTARDGSLWIGTMADGLRRLHPGGKLQVFPVQAGQRGATSSGGIMSITEGRDGRIWIGTYGGGVNIVDPASGVVRQLPHGNDSGAISGARVTSVLEDTKGRFWLATDGSGVSVVDSRARLLRTFMPDRTDLNSLPSNTVYALAEDASGRVWIGTSSGIVRALNADEKPEELRLSAVSATSGSLSQVAYGLVGDPRGGMWISGNAGLLYLDPDSGATRAYHRADGLQGEEFSFGAYHRLRDGRICFGGPGGFNIFDPRLLAAPRQPPSVVLTHIDVLGAPASGETPFWTRQSLDLDYRDSIVSLDFSVLDQTTPEHTRLSYRVPGLSDQWMDLGAQRRVTLTNLEAGSHVLEVRAASADSTWSQTPLRISIHRDPAPWRTPWAYALYISLAIALIALRAVRQGRKVRAMRRTQEYLESQVRARTSELMDSNQRLAEAAKAKSDFLDRMSHELRTPMNGVVGMTELLSRTHQTSAQAQLTRTISSSANLLLRIVNDLLDLSKIRAGKVQLEQIPVDLCQLIEECTSLFTTAADSKGLKLVACPPAQWRRSLVGDPLRMRQILVNLIGNALKFTARGEVVVRADVDPAGAGQALLRLAVSDTGIGIDETALGRIFEPFTQADEKTTRQFGGTGLGLPICRELAELMGGTITVKSRPQVGSSFCLEVQLPIGDSLDSDAGLPPSPVQICTRSTSLAECLQRLCATLGVPLAGNDSNVDAAGMVQIIDAATEGERLPRLLAGAPASRARLLVIATSAEAEHFGLRMLLRDAAILSRPVLRHALRDALAAAMGVQTTVPDQVSTGLTRLSGHVLLVEDDPVNAAVAEGYLEASGCRCTWVSGGQTALSLAQSQRFDMVLMDLNMPDMDGIAVTQRLREAESQHGAGRTPIIALTAHDAQGHRERVLRAGMDGILSKPCSLPEFHAMLARWLSGNAAAPAASEVPTQVADTELASVDVATVQVIARMGSGGSAGLFQKLVGLFEESSRPLVSALAAAVAEHRFADAAGICHRLKSSAANVGAMTFSAALRELEQQCRAGDSPAATEACRRVVDAHEPLLSALRGFHWAESA